MLDGSQSQVFKATADQPHCSRARDKNAWFNSECLILIAIARRERNAWCRDPLSPRNGRVVQSQNLSRDATFTR